MATCSTAVLRKASSSGGIGLLSRSLNRGVSGVPRADSYKSSSSKSVQMSFKTTGMGLSSSLGTTEVGSHMVRRLEGGGGAVHARHWLRSSCSVSARVSFIR